jgi:hypothetical protein
MGIRALEFKPAFNEHPSMQGRNGEIYQVRRVTYMPDYGWDAEDLRFLRELKRKKRKR